MITIKKLTLDEIKIKCKEKGLLCLNEEYNGQNTIINFICEKHKDKGVQQKSWKNIAKSIGCNYCAKEQRSNTRKEDINVIRQQFADKGLLLVSTEYIPKQKLKFICHKHRNKGIQEISYNKFKYSNQGCKYCSSHPFIDIEVVKEEFKELNKIDNYEYELLSTEYKNSTSKLLFKHTNCDNKFEMSWDCYKRGQRCKKCQTSKGEKSIRNYLIYNDIDFKEQYRIKECKDKYTLPFDFYLIDYNILIEYDGEQHYRPTTRYGGSDKFKIQKEHDKIKDKYCKDNNIRLLRIPYWELKNIETILNEALFENNKAFFIA